MMPRESVLPLLVLINGINSKILDTSVVFTKGSFYEPKNEKEYIGNISALG